MREEGNPIYAFLFDLDCQEGQYYRWRTFGKYLLVRCFLQVCSFFLAFLSSVLAYEYTFFHLRLISSSFLYHLAFAWGDTLQRWHDQPLQWSVGGLVIAAPPCPIDKESADADSDRAEAGIYGSGGGKKDSAGVHGRDREGRRKR